jgi:hypothetical protein
VIKLASRCAAVVVAGSALTLAVGLLPAQAATTGWRTDATLAVRGEDSIITSVAASSPSDAWATGFAVKTNGTALPQAVIRRWTGKAWRTVTLPAKIGREWAGRGAIGGPVGAASARSVWIFGDFAGGYLRLDGSRWSLGQLPGASKKSGAVVLIDAVKVFSGTNVWVVGERLSASGVATPYAAHYNGREWSTTVVPALPSGGGDITAVAAVSSGDLWAVESGVTSPPVAANSAVAKSALAASPAARLAAARLRAGASAAASSVVLQWTASTGWQKASQQPSLAASDQLSSVVAEPNGDVWVGGAANNKKKGTTPLATEWNGTSWSVKDLLGKASSADWELGSMAPDGTGGIWALAANETSGAERIWHLHGTTWSQARPAFGKHQWILEALAVVPGTHSAWAVGAVRVGKSGANGLIAVDGSLPR